MNTAPSLTIAANRGPTTVVPAAGNTLYTCPMHPEVQQDHPGNCPKCGMALVLKTPTASPDQAENAELHDMTKRFWVSAVLTLPVFVQPDHCRRRDEPEFPLDHQQRLAAA